MNTSFPAHFTLQYCTVDKAIEVINKLGPGTLMGKIDLKSAFRQCPVRRQDWELLGVKWRGKYYVDKCLPFGLRSASFLFNRVAEAIEWALKNNYSIEDLFHYLDDFFTAGPPGSPVCKNNIQTMLTICDKLGPPVKPEKVEGPTTLMEFLGILLDSINMTAGISPARKAELTAELLDMASRMKCRKRNLLSLIGKLSFACKVVPAGRIFLRRLIDRSCTVKHLHHWLHLTKETQADLQWWLTFSQTGRAQA